MGENEAGGAFGSLDLAYCSAQDKLKFQSEQWNAIDNKNSVVLAVYGIVMAIFLTADLKDSFVPYDKPVLFLWLLSIVAGMACSLVSLLPKDIDVPPNMRAFVDKYLHRESDDTKKQLLSKMVASIERNSGVIHQKQRLLLWSIMAFLPFSLCVSATAILIKYLIKG